jgi:hypothetical protein
MSNEEKKINAIVDRGVDAVVAGDAKGKVITKANAEQLVEAGKEVLRGAATGAAKGAIKGAVVGAIEGAVESANQAAAQATGKRPISDDPAKSASERPRLS